MIGVELFFAVPGFRGHPVFPGTLHGNQLRRNENARGEYDLFRAAVPIKKKYF
jgi:hypothetical protein